MSQHTSFIPPNVTPPDPPEAKVVALVFSIFMSVILLAFIGFICVDFLADIAEYPLTHDAPQEQTIQEVCGPFISEFLGLNFPGQYAPMFGKDARSENYDLTKEDRKQAIQKLRETLQNTEEVSVEIVGIDRQQNTSEKYLPLDGSDLLHELCKQVDLVEDTCITPLDDMCVPDIVFTFYPSEMKINIMESHPEASFVHVPFLYVTLGEGMQRWEGNFGNGLMMTLLNTRLQGGQTVRSYVVERLPFFPLDSVTPRSDAEEKSVE